MRAGPTMRVPLRARRKAWFYVAAAIVILAFVSNRIPKSPDRSSKDPAVYVARLGELEGRGKAIHALFDIGQPSVAPVVEALDDPDSDTREGATRALGRLAQSAETSIPIKDLLVLVRHSDQSIRITAIRTIIAIVDAKDYEYRVARNHDIEDAAVQPFSAIVEQVLPEMRALLKDKGQSREVRLAAAEAAGTAAGTQFVSDAEQDAVTNELYGVLKQYGDRAMAKRWFENGVSEAHPLARAAQRWAGDNGTRFYWGQ